jgi:hypothetical protein
MNTLAKGMGLPKSSTTRPWIDCVYPNESKIQVRNVKNTLVIIVEIHLIKEIHFYNVLLTKMLSGGMKYFLIDAT